MAPNKIKIRSLISSDTPLTFKYVQLNYNLYIYIFTFGLFKSDPHSLLIANVCYDSWCLLIKNNLISPTPPFFFFFVINLLEKWASIVIKLPSV